MGQRDTAKEKFRRAAIKRWQSGGLAVNDFGEQEKIEKSKFAYWRREIRRRDYGEVPRPGKAQNAKSDTNPLFVPVKVEEEKNVSTKVKPATADIIEIQTPGGYLARISA